MGKTIREYIEEGVKRKASDLFFQSGSLPYAKVDGSVTSLDNELLTENIVEAFIDEMFSTTDDNGAKRSKERFFTDGDDDFSYEIQGLARFRANVYHQRGTCGVVLRIVSFRIPDYKQLHIPENILQLGNAKSGLLIVCGPTGSGKSTTLACIINHINNTRPVHIVTLEDPIEYYHENHKALITQRDIPVDASNFASALRAALRQAPDIILLGEMRDPETIRIAVTAAETGHLVIATLHTRDSIGAIDRIIDTFPASQQTQIRTQLAGALYAVVSQRLIPGLKEPVVPAFEIMFANLAVRNLIRENQAHQITSVMTGNKENGMMALDDSLFDLYRNHMISADNMFAYCTNQKIMKEKIEKKKENASGSQSTHAEKPSFSTFASMQRNK